MSDHPTADQMVCVNLIYGFKRLEPLVYTRMVERLGWLNWQWIIECKYSRCTLDGFRTKAAAERDMARYPT